MKEKWLLVPVVAVFAVLLSVSVVHAALTFTSTAVTSDGAITLTTGAVSTAVTVTYGINANAATTTDSLYVGGVLQHTGGTASGTALVIGGDGPGFRSAANTLKVQGTIALQNSETIGNSTNNVVFVNSTSVVAATSSATTTPGLWVSKQAGTASTTTLQIGGMDENGETHSGKSCIQMWRGNRPSKVYLDAAGTALVVAVGTCSDT